MPIFNGFNKKENNPILSKQFYKEKELAETDISKYYKIAFITFLLFYTF